MLTLYLLVLQGLAHHLCSTIEHGWLLLGHGVCNELHGPGLVLLKSLEVIGECPLSLHLVHLDLEVYLGLLGGQTEVRVLILDLHRSHVLLLGKWLECL